MEESSAKLGLFIWGPSVFHVPPAGVGVFMVNAQALCLGGRADGTHCLAILRPQLGVREHSHASKEPQGTRRTFVVWPPAIRLATIHTAHWWSLFNPSKDFDLRGGQRDEGNSIYPAYRRHPVRLGSPLDPKVVSSVTLGAQETRIKRKYFSKLGVFLEVGSCHVRVTGNVPISRPQLSPARWRGQTMHRPVTTFVVLGPVRAEWGEEMYGVVHATDF